MRGEIVCSTEGAAPWSLSFRRPGAHLHIVERGTAWLQVDGSEEFMRLNAGDLVVLPLGGGHVLGSDTAGDQTEHPDVRLN